MYGLASGATHDKPPELGSRPSLRRGAAVLDQFVTYPAVSRILEVKRSNVDGR